MFKVKKITDEEIIKIFEDVGLTISFLETPKTEEEVEAEINELFPMMRCEIIPKTLKCERKSYQVNENISFAA